LILLRNPHDLRRHRGGKEDGLPLLRHVLQDRFNILPEAHAEHFIRLIEDNHVQIVELQRAAPHMVHHAPRRAHHDLRAAAQGGELALDRLATVNGYHLEKRLVFCEFSDFVAGLHGELARWAENQHLGFAPAGGINFFNGRDAERGRFARARLRMADDIPAGKNHWNTRRLDTGGLFKAHLLHGALHFIGQLHIGELDFLHVFSSFSKK